MNDDARRRHGVRLERAQASAQFARGRFRNPSGVRAVLQGPALPILGRFLFHRGRRTPDGPLPVEDPRDAWARPPDTGLRATWLGHSTVLLELDGRRVLTDPVLGDRASPVRFAGPRRFHPPPVPVAALPLLDAVVLSHDHYDHLCRRTVQALARSGVPFVAPLGVGRYLEAWGVDPGRITELDWGEAAEVGGLGLTATPAQHFSGRGARRNRTLWCSWVIASGRRRVFFSGDTGLFPGLREIGARHGPFDLTLLEIGAFHPAWGSIHLGPENALEASVWLGGGPLLPIHWATFNLGLHDWDEPAEALVTLAAGRGTRLVTPRLGQPCEPDHARATDPWWREVRP